MMMMIMCVSHVTSGRSCHMLPRGARVTCYPGARVSHVTPGRPCHTGEAKRLIGRRYLFCVHDTRQRCCCSAMTSANEKGVGCSPLRRRRMRASPSQPTPRLQRSSQGLLGLILEQGIESLNQVIRWSSLDDCTDLVGKANGHKLRKGWYTAQDHVADQPLDVVIQALRERPVSDEARFRSHSLHGV